MDDRPTEPDELFDGDDASADLTPAELAEAEAALAEYEATGEYYDWEDVRPWLLSWGTNNVLPHPKPRYRS